MKEIGSFRQLVKYIGDSCSDHFASKNLNKWLRAFCAQVLGFTVLYTIGLWLAPFQDFWANNFTLAGFAAIFQALWKMIPKPEVFNEIFSGRILYKLSIPVLNALISILSVILLSTYIAPFLIKKYVYVHESN